LAKAIDGYKSDVAALMVFQFNIDALVTEGKVIPVDPGSEASGGSVAADK
jgi:hypothetical protein